MNSKIKSFISSLVLLCAMIPVFGAGVPLRVSVKFILNSSGNRPATGAINTDAAVNAQVERANQIWSDLRSEFRVENLEIADVSGAFMWYTAGTTLRDDLRAIAMADPTRYRWRTDAVNVYITAANDSAVADFPPNNNIILLCQGISDTTLAHEIGHILALYHTHEPGVWWSNGDECDDTIKDDPSWDTNDIALINFQRPYSQLNATEQRRVDLTWWNVMSYHNMDDRSKLSECQMDRQSKQGYGDRSRLLSAIPVYVDAASGGLWRDGSFTDPFQTIQEAINTGALNNKVLVLQAGIHPQPSSVLNTATTVITRRGYSFVQEAPPLFSLPYTLEESTNAAVREAVLEAQRSDRGKDLPGVIRHLQVAEKNAAGREKSALQLQLAQRMRDAGRYEEAAAYFEQTAKDADQEGLRKHALRKADDMRKAHRNSGNKNQAK